MEDPQVMDIGEADVPKLQTLLNAGLNIFAVELLAESWLRGLSEALHGKGLRFTFLARPESGKPDKLPVRFTIESVDQEPTSEAPQ
jgi:hypothetical protein